LVPIADAIAKRNQIPAGYLLPALTLSASYSFMLPVATPTNAIVFGPGYLTIKDMVGKRILEILLCRSDKLLV